MSRTLAFVVGCALDAAFGDPPTRWHPVGLVGRAAQALHSCAPAEAPARLGYGAAVAVGLPVVGALASGLLLSLAGRRRCLARFALESALFSTTLALRTLLLRGSEVADALEAGDLPRARTLTGYHLVSRDTSALDASGIAAAVVESVAENLSDGVVAPALAFAMGGVRGAAAYRVANTLDALWGYRDEDFEELGKAAARLDDALNLLPARVTAAALIASAHFRRGDGFDVEGALATWRQDRGRTASPNAGHPMAAMAGALGVRLEKEGHYVLGDSLRPPAAPDVRRAVNLARTAAWLVLGGIALGLLGRGAGL